MRLFDTYSKSLVDLPAAPGPVRMYFCGPTVYARAHVGNARPFVVGMWLRSWLRSQGYDATLVHNITDVNDKIYDAAPGGSAALAEQATAWYVEDVGDLLLGAAPDYLPDHMPKVTDHIPEIVAFIGSLVEAGHAYSVNGDVYFRVRSFPEYGRLSGNRPDQMEDLEPNPLKEDPRDFALWKTNKPGEDTSWESPWGRGRPGWHIECSAMAEECFGPSFEIHGGGLDLVFPHHENELAQSRALGHPFAQVWAHNGLLQFTGEKMSKSVGNITTIREVLDKRWIDATGREAFILFLLTGHWRKPLDFSWDLLHDAVLGVRGFRRAFKTSGEPSSFSNAIAREWDDFEAALNDDFNTPAALSMMFAWSGAQRLDELRKALKIFGLSSIEHDDVPIPDAPEEIKNLARLREAHRKLGEYAKADILRDELDAAGWQMNDGPRGYILLPKE